LAIFQLIPYNKRTKRTLHLAKKRARITDPSGYWEDKKMGQYFPFVLQIDVTPRCNLDCLHCRTSHGATGELNSAEWIEILGPIFSHFRRRIQWVVIGGGEPTLYPELGRLISYISRKTRVVLLMTNGVLIATNPPLLEELMAAGLNRLQLSLESPVPEIHDTIRGQGNFYLVMQAAQVCHRLNINLAFRMTLNGLNWPQYGEFITLCKRLGAKEANLRKVIPVGKAEANFSWDCISPQDHCKILTDFPQLGEKHGILVNSEDPYRFIVDPRFQRLASSNSCFLRGCPAGTGHAYISPEGQVRPCSNIPFVLGDLREESFVDIWENHEWMIRLRERNYAKCADCSYKTICGGCRAMAKAYSGDWWGVDPDCWL